MDILSKSRIEYEDEHVLIVYKPAGVLSQGDHTGDASIVDLAQKLIGTKDPVYLIHRIDRPVSGLITIAKTKRSAELFSRLLKKGRIRKKYNAVVFGIPTQTSGELKHYLLEREGEPTLAFDGVPKNDNPKKYKEAVLKYEVLKSSKFHSIKEFDNSFSLISIELITGRKHQIRTQFAHIGCPIVGDSKYFSQADDVKKKMLDVSFLPRGEIALSAVYLGFPHPLKNGNIVEVKIPTPEHWVKFVG